MKILELSISQTIAEHYHRDARDFSKRFDTLWEDQLHKTGRIKTFVDLVMGCECALKSHVFLGQRDQDPVDTYNKIRRAGHNVGKLSTLASFMQERDTYEAIANDLERFSVFIRYSLDAYSTFFPALAERADAPIHYSRTIGNNDWVLNVRKRLEVLIEVACPELTGEVNPDICAILDHELKMEEFMRTIAPRAVAVAR